MKYLFAILLSSTFLFSDSDYPYFDSPYFDYANVLGPFGNVKEGEIEIISDRDKIAEIEKNTGRKVGIIAEDKYWIWINDAVQFPSGAYGVYGRIIWRQSLRGTPGVAVMALLPNGKIALNRNYRHATRSWEYELPRGGVNTNESIEDAALREVREETGLLIDNVEFLGNMASDSGFSNTIIPVFLAKVVGNQETEQENSEAIAGIDAFTIEEIKQGLRQGYLMSDSHKIPLRDAFLTFALLQYEIRYPHE